MTKEQFKMVESLWKDPTSCVGNFGTESYWFNRYTYTYVEGDGYVKTGGEYFKKIYEVAASLGLK